MGNLSEQDKKVIRRGAWCNDTRIPEHMQKHYRIQLRHGNGAWMDRFGELNKAQASIYWAGQTAFNGWEARLLKRGKEIARKGE
jgi:hypothetical protein